jgi:hypothetical protein
MKCSLLIVKCEGFFVYVELMLIIIMCFFLWSSEGLLIIIMCFFFFLWSSVGCERNFKEKMLGDNGLGYG